MDIDHLIAAGNPEWERLDALLARIDAGHGFDRRQLAELVALYRRVADDLLRARLLTANPEILGRLNALAGRAYRVVHGQRRGRWRWAQIARFYLDEVPRSLRACRIHVLAATLLLTLGAAFGFACVMRDPGLASELVPAMFYSENPAERVAKIEHGEERVDELVEAASFAAELYVHNIRVALLAFGLGALTVVGGWWLLLVNGALLGAVSAQYVRDDVGGFLVAWVGPHGALELPAIVVAAAAGLRCGGALFVPGEAGRPAALRAALPDCWRLLGAACTMLVFAGLIEGSFSQFSARIVPHGVKIAVAAALFALVAAYLSGRLARRGSSP